MSDIDKEKVIEKRWEEFYEWLETCPIEWTEGRHPTSGMISVNFDVVIFGSSLPLLPSVQRV